MRKSKSQSRMSALGIGIPLAEESVRVIQLLSLVHPI